MNVFFVSNSSAVYWRRHAFFLSLLYFLAACACPALYFQKTSDASKLILYWGVELLASGWMGILYWKTLAWLANPFYFATLLCFMHWGRGAKIVFSSLALFFALLTLELFSRYGLSDDRWGQLVLVRLGVGFYFWMISILILFYAALADTKSGDAFFRHMLPKLHIAGWPLPSALLVTLLLSLPAITVSGVYLSI